MPVCSSSSLQYSQSAGLPTAAAACCAAAGRVILHTQHTTVPYSQYVGYTSSTTQLTCRGRKYISWQECQITLPNAGLQLKSSSTHIQLHEKIQSQYATHRGNAYSAPSALLHVTPCSLLSPSTNLEARRASEPSTASRSCSTHTIGHGAVNNRPHPH